MKNGKKTAAAIIGGLLIIALIATGVHFMFKKEIVTDCTSLTLRLSGMRVTEEYEVTCDGKTAEISLYCFNYADGTEKRVLVSSATCPAEEFIGVLNQCHLMKWDGFYGKHPRGVLDGTMFSLTATVNGGVEIHANGSQNFPKNYYVLLDWLGELTHNP